MNESSLESCISRGRSGRRLLIVGLLAFAGMFLIHQQTRAEQIYGLTTGAGLFSFDSATPNTVSAVIPITGIDSGFALKRIDFRVANGQLYGFAVNVGGASGQVYLINVNTGAASAVGSAVALPGPATTFFATDFNPVVDRLRAVGISGANYRFNPNDGSLQSMDSNVNFDPGDPNFDADFPAQVVGLAYTNNITGAVTTTLYAYDFTNDVIATQGGLNGTPSPNGGLLFTVGASGIVTASASIGFDISPTGVAYLSADVDGTGQDNLYTVNLATGAATLVGPIGGSKCAILR